MLIRTDNQPTGLGYLEIDHRNSPELPPGVACLYLEADTYTCTHCQRVVFLNPERTRERYKCRGCNHHICDDCAAARAAGTPCKTFAQVIDEELERVEKQTAGGIILP